jgi:hypothetical protein
MTPEEFLELKKQVESLQRRADKASGVREATLKTLREEHGCDSVKAGERLLKKLEAELKEREKEADEAAREFNEKWKDELQR